MNKPHQLVPEFAADACWTEEVHQDRKLQPCTSHMQSISQSIASLSMSPHHNINYHHHQPCENHVVLVPHSSCPN